MLQLSVILPIYNVEPYLERCIRSLLDQDIAPDNYEIICVNDGSPDNSREVVLSLQKESSNIIFVDQENMGVSRARNAGIERSQGTYLLFVDPDDYIMKNSLGSMLKEAEHHKAHITIPGYKYQNSEGNVEHIKTFRQHKGQVVSGIESYYLMREKKELIPDSSVGIIIDAEFMKEHRLLYLPDVPLNQDVEILTRIHCTAERAIFSEHFLYVACARPGSATRSNQFGTARVRIGFGLAAKNLKNFQESEYLLKAQRMFLNGPIVQFVLLSLYSAMQTRSLKTISETVRALKSDGLDRLALAGCKGYHLNCGRAFNLSPYLGAMVMKVYFQMERWEKRRALERADNEQKN